jgi:hypothetical protein
MRRAVLILSLLIFLSSLVMAEAEIPVKVKADRLKYYEQSGLVEAFGSVEVKLKDVTINADHLLMDSSSNLATAEGNVRLLSSEYRASADHIVYDPDRDISSFSDFSTWVTPQKMRGKLFLKANNLTDLKSRMEGAQGLLTTCEQKLPHFFMRADRVEYYPNNHVEGYNVTVYEGELPVFWLPYLYYDLQRQRRKNWTFGHNNVEGDYLKTTWDYPGGIFLLDYMQYKGWGNGISTNLVSSLGAGTLFLYFLDEKDTGIHDRVMKITQQTQLAPNTKLNLNQSYISTYGIPSGRIDQTNFGMSLNYAEKTSSNLSLSVLDDRIGQNENYNFAYNHSAGLSYTDYYYNYNFSKVAPTWMQKSQRLYTRFPLWSDRVNFSTTTSYYHRVAGAGDSGEERIDPQIEITGSAPSFSWVYRENWLLDLRKDLSPGTPRYESLEKQPEIEVSPNPIDMKLFNLRSTFGYGSYREVKYVPALGKKRDYTTQRYRAALNIDKNVPLGLGTVMFLGAGLNQYLYAPGDELYAYNENGSLRTDLGGFFRNDFSYRKGYTDGNSPFLFDKLNTSYHDGRDRMTFYYLNKWFWWVDGGRNWQTNKWFDLMSHMELTPDSRLRWSVDTGWDIENTVYKDLVSSLALIPTDYFSTYLNLNHDLNQGQLKSASISYDMYFLKGEPNQTRLQFNQVFDPSTKDFKVRDIMILKDLHCWEMKYVYSDYRKEFSVVFSLKAMPGEPVGFQTGRGFYYDGFERELQQLKPEGQIRRY